MRHFQKKWPRFFFPLKNSGRWKPFSLLFFSSLGSPFIKLHTMTGFSAMAVPTGFSPEGFLVSLQIVISHWEEGRFFRIASAYEKVTLEFRRQRPTIS